MREPYSTKLEPSLVKALKYQAIDEKRFVNDILEEAIKDYFKKKGVKIEANK